MLLQLAHWVIVEHHSRCIDTTKYVHIVIASIDDLPIVICYRVLPKTDLIKNWRKQIILVIIDLSGSMQGTSPPVDCLCKRDRANQQASGGGRRRRPRLYANVKPWITGEERPATAHVTMWSSGPSKMCVMHHVSFAFLAPINLSCLWISVVSLVTHKQANQLDKSSIAIYFFLCICNLNLRFYSVIIKLSIQLFFTVLFVICYQIFECVRDILSGSFLSVFE